MLSAGLSQKEKEELWTEAASTATKLDNIMCEKGHQSPHYTFYNKNPEYEDHLRIFGELGIVTFKPGPGIKSKLEIEGLSACFWVMQQIMLGMSTEC